MFNPTLAPLRITAPSSNHLKPIVISFNSTSPIPIALALAADRVKVAVLETFDGTFNLQIGDSENHSRFVSIPNTQLIAGNIFDFNCGYLYSSHTYIYAYISGTATTGKLYLYFQDVNSIVNSSEIPTGGLGGDWGINNYRYEYRSNAGGISDADRRSGFYQSSGTLSNYPINSGIWHFLNVSSDDTLNNLQICGAIDNQIFYGRKTNGNAAQGWSQFITTFNSETKITGRFGINNSGTLGAFADIVCSSNAIGLLITGNASQSQDLVQVKNGSGNTIVSITSGGNLAAQNINSTGRIGVNTPSPNAFIDIANSSNLPALKITGNVSQSGDLIQVFDSTGTSLASLTYQGHFFAQNINATGRIGINVAGTAGAFIDASCSSNAIGLRITGNASQSLDLAQFRNSAGTVLSNLTFQGHFFAQNINSTGRIGVNISGSAGGFVDVNCSSNAIGLRITGNASQTQDLLQLKNSLGTTLANINSAGSLAVQSLKTNLVGSATRIASVDLSGNLGVGGEIIDGFITNSTVINLLSNNSNWTSKVYTGTAISGTYAGQIYIGTDYFYYFKSDNVPVRMALV